MSDPRFAENDEDLQSRTLREDDEPELNAEDDPRAPAVTEAAGTPLDRVDEVDEAGSYDDDVDRDALAERTDADDDAVLVGSPVSEQATDGTLGSTGTAGSAAGSFGSTAGTTGTDDDSAGRFFEDSVSEKLHDRWQTIQIDFVDDPRNAVEQAESLVEQVSTQLTEAIAARRSELHSRWSKDGGSVSAAHDDGVATEDLRTALQEYRRVLNQLLAV
ncbi:hypothetical protein ACEZDB_07300 [Streptacidiphilus sp. N1-3]|uniref:Uncharacterized protein n=1 Tax=Streptacidiphilus alkalitolerans TaxID=3342712 RepID=A0ABV6WWQ3_9ACTN